ncbi:MAG: TonB-dependent receptor [Lutibacter sp.]|nr:TonB-dependent receptor [Lutibacter sp.]
MAIVSLVCCVTVGAQEVLIIQGKVTNQGMAVPAATVQVKDSGQKVLTNDTGHFTLSLTPGSHHLIVRTADKVKAHKIEAYQGKEILLELSERLVILDEVLVSAVRVQENDPLTHSNLSKAVLAKRNLGQDIPVLIKHLPSVVSTSDAGAGVGYTGIRVRGSDATRVNVTINGIPYNDAESQGTFWVNLPDFTSSIESIQLQRGVGTSTNGSGAFGASLHLSTEAVPEQAFAEISTAAGSYHTFKNTLKFGTGKINEHINFSGRFSKIRSDGYIDRAWSDLSAYFLQASYTDENTLIKALAFGGLEETYQAWYGVTKEEMETLGRTHNPYSYDNEIDHYQQDHFQGHWHQKLSEKWETNIGLNYTYGRGYFEQYKPAESFADYDLTPIEMGGEIIDETALIRRRWLDNDFYVANAHAAYKAGKSSLIFGGSYSHYKGRHFGEIIWAAYTGGSDIRDRYYESDALKTDLNVFGKWTWRWSAAWSLFTDLQGRFVQYQTQGLTSDRDPIAVDRHFSFFNPKAGINYQATTQHSYYLSYAKASKEPNRNDFENGITKAEKLHDLEIGWRYKSNRTQWNANLYYMYYRDQLVLTGALDDVGAPIRATSGKSHRLGMELSASLALSDKVSLESNLALSSNKNIDFYTPIDGVLTRLGTTNLPFSPAVITGNSLRYSPSKNWELAFLSKYVGKQFMGNLDSAVSGNDVLKAYCINDLNASLEIAPKGICKKIVLRALVNNLFNVQYISNGYYYTYDDTWSVPGTTTTVDGAGYYPQATRNFLLGATLHF